MDEVYIDGRPMVTDVFLVRLVNTVDDFYGLREALICWVEGDWEGAMEFLEDE